MTHRMVLQHVVVYHPERMESNCSICGNLWPSHTFYLVPSADQESPLRFCDACARELHWCLGQVLGGD